MNASDQQDILDTTNIKKVNVNATDQQDTEDTTNMKKDLVDTTDLQRTSSTPRKLPLGPQTVSVLSNCSVTCFNLLLPLV